MYPIDARAARGSADTSKPATRARPEVAGSSVVSTLMVVVLPAPFGAEQAEHLARRDGEGDPGERLNVAETHAQVVDQHGAVAGRDSRDRVHGRGVRAPGRASPGGTAPPAVASASRILRLTRLR